MLANDLFSIDLSLEWTYFIDFPRFNLLADFFFSSGFMTELVRYFCRLVWVSDKSAFFCFFFFLPSVFPFFAFLAVRLRGFFSFSREVDALLAAESLF